MEIIKRALWGAAYAAGFGPAPPASELWLHHSVTTSAGAGAPFAADVATVLQLEQIGQERFGGGISYTFAVCQSGRVFEGTGPLRKGSHTAGRNARARAICLVGDYSTRSPTEAQILAVAELVRLGHAQGWWTVDRLSGGHRDAPGAQTECPGDAGMACIPTINRLALNGRKDDEMTPEQARKIDEIHAELTRRIINRRASQGMPNPAGGSDTMLGWSVFADGFGFRNENTLVKVVNDLHSVHLALGELHRKIDALTARLEAMP